MLKVRNIEIKNPYGAGFECKVTLQFGPGTYDKAEIELSPADVREIVALAIDKATAMISVDASEIKVAGEAGDQGIVEVAATPEPVNGKAPPELIAADQEEF